MRVVLNKRKLQLAGVIVVIVVALVATAIAYWTSSGEGTGQATASTGGSHLTVEGNPANGIFPGGEVALSTVVKNVDPKQAEWFGTLKTTIAIDSTHAEAGCLAAWFTYKPNSAASGAANPYTQSGISTELPKEGSTTIAGKVFMSNLPSTDQSACKGATLNLAYEAS
jgi:hypothetical protein